MTDDPLITLAKYHGTCRVCEARHINAGDVIIAFGGGWAAKACYEKQQEALAVLKKAEEEMLKRGYVLGSHFTESAVPVSTRAEWLKFARDWGVVTPEEERLLIWWWKDVLYRDLFD